MLKSSKFKQFISIRFCLIQVFRMSNFFKKNLLFLKGRQQNIWKTSSIIPVHFKNFYADFRYCFPSELISHHNTLKNARTTITGLQPKLWNKILWLFLNFLDQISDNSKWLCQQKYVFSSYMFIYAKRESNAKGLITNQ